MKKLLAGLLLSVPLAVAASELENLRVSAEESLKDAVASPVATAKFLPAPPAAPHALAAGRVDLEAWFAAGGSVAKADVSGWYAGRRLTPKGWAAALLVGADLLLDPAAGPVGGSTFKLMVQGADAPGLSPEHFYDEMYPPKVEGIMSWIERTSGDWSDAEIGGASALAFKGPHKHEVRKYGDYLVLKYPTGEFGYFFKKVR